MKKTLVIFHTIALIAPAALIFVLSCSGIQRGNGQVTYLSDQWAHSVLREMKRDGGFVQAVHGLNITLQYNVSDIPGAPGKVITYYTRYGFNGPVAMEIGSAEKPEVVFSGTYEVWKKIHTGEITLKEALEQRVVNYYGDYRAVSLFLDRLEKFGEPLSSIYMRVPTIWLSAPEEAIGQ